jgi:hypothetical protein
MPERDFITSDHQRAYAKAYYEANKEKVLARQKARYAASSTTDKERMLAQCRAYRQANRDKDLARKRAYRQANREAIQARRRGPQIKRDYGLTLADVAIMERTQRGRCWICKTPFGVKGFQVDHCHATGKVRGLLCGSCNSGLGFFGDNPGLLKRAIKYLKETGNC